MALNVTDISFLKSFCENDPARIKKYVDIFLTTLSPTIHKINEAVLNKDWIQIADQAHGLRTKCMLMGMKATQDLSVKIEEDCRRNNITNELTENIRILISHLQQSEYELSSVV